MLDAGANCPDVERLIGAERIIAKAQRGVRINLPIAAEHIGQCVRPHQAPSTSVGHPCIILIDCELTQCGAVHSIGSFEPAVAELIFGADANDPIASYLNIISGLDADATTAESEAIAVERFGISRLSFNRLTALVDIIIFRLLLFIPRPA